MKLKYIFLAFIAVLYAWNANAQIEPRITKVALSEQDRAIVSQHLSEYTAFTIDKKALVDSLYNNGKCKFQLHIDERHNWTINLQFNDMRAPNYKQTYVSDKGTFEREPFRVNTFKGTTSGNQAVRFSIDENNFFGVVFDEKLHYVIRPISDFTKNNSDERLIVYKNSDIIVTNENSDYINDAITAPVDEKNKKTEGNMTRGGAPCTYYLEIATDADYEFYQIHGNNTNSYILSVLNVVEGIYQSTFDMKFIVTYQNVWTTQSNGYPYTSTSAGVLLTNQFYPYWDSNMTGVQRDIAHLFTGKDIGPGVGGIAYLGTLGGSHSYSLSRLQDHPHVVTAHEIGHVLGGLHTIPLPNDCLCNDNYLSSIMCPSTAHDMPNLWFCQISINEISALLAINSSILTNPFPNTLILTGTQNGFNEYKATQTITSDQVINSGYTIYKTPAAELTNGFEVKSGAVFEITDDGGCQ